MSVQTISPVGRTTSLTQGSTLTFHDVCYKVKVRVPGSKCATYEKEILVDVSGIFKQGMNAILGPTGSGKSSLLDIIAGRKDPRGLRGTLLVDGSAQPKNYKCMTGYVVQDDIVTGTLTVRENLMFSANLRLSPSISQKEKLQRVEDTLYELGLEKCADTKLGTEFIRGVSGGERKRTNIGMELIIGPPVLFLDEPTTGLDASTSNAVMTLLHRLSRRGRTIIFSIHQPRYTIFKKFDQLMLLSEGRTVYHGPASDALQYFDNHGYVCEEHNNPPDFFLDVILGDMLPVNEQTLSNGKQLKYGETTSKDGVEMTSFSGSISNGPTPVVDAENGEGEVESKYHEREEIAIKLSGFYSMSQWSSQLHEEIDPIYSEYQKRVESGTERQPIVGEYANGFFSQVRTLSGRALRNLVRDPQTFSMQMFMSIFMSLVAGTIYLQLDNNLPGGIQNRAGAFFFITMNMVFSSMSAVVIFIHERAIFIHENVSGFYRVSSYFVAKVLFDIIPLRFLPATIYAVVTYFMIGFRVEVAKFFTFYLTLILTTFTAVSIAFFGSCISPLYAVANLVCILIAILMMIFGGLLVNIDTLGDWLSWLQYLSMFRYALKSLYITEFKDQAFCFKTNNDTMHVCDERLGNQYLTDQGISYETAWDLWQNILALGGIMLFFMTLAYILLRTAKKLK